MLQIGNDKIKDVYVGSDKIKEVYYGSEKVWGEIVPIQEGYWVDADTGVKTYFDLTDPSITDGIMSSPPWGWGEDGSEVKIPEGVTSLGGSCFAECWKLTSITLPESVTSLGAECFHGCVTLTSITLPEGVTSIGLGCFTYCHAFTSINIPESVTSIGGYCFMGCISLTLLTVLPATPPTLGGEAFRNTPESLNIKVRSPYVSRYKTATNWNQYSSKISAI